MNTKPSPSRAHRHAPAKSKLPELRNQLVKKYIRQEVESAMTSFVEVKFVDSYAGYVQPDRGGNIYQLTFNTNAGSGITQGAGGSQRVGDRIKLKNYEVRFSFYYGASLVIANPQHTIRLIMFRWRLDTALAGPSIANILQWQSGGSSDFRPVVSPINDQFSKNGDFVILKDETYTLGAYANLPAPKWFGKLNSAIEFDPAGVAGSGHLYLLVVADDVSGAHTPDIQYQYISRVHYEDS